MTLRAAVEAPMLGVDSSAYAREVDVRVHEPRGRSAVECHERVCPDLRSLAATPCVFGNDVGQRQYHVRLVGHPLCLKRCQIVLWVSQPLPSGAGVRDSITDMAGLFGQHDPPREPVTVLIPTHVAWVGPVTQWHDHLHKGKCQQRCCRNACDQRGLKGGRQLAVDPCSAAQVEPANEWSRPVGREEDQGRAYHDPREHSYREKQPRGHMKHT